jgi:hypothetical protein
MPLYAYRCDCGDVIEHLVRSGREPQSGADIGHVCDSTGQLHKLLSAPKIGRSGAHPHPPRVPDCLAVPGGVRAAHPQPHPQRVPQRVP